MLTRRRFIKAAFAATAGIAAAGAYARFIEPEWLEFVHHDLPVDALPPALEGCLLAQLSDLHSGRQVSADYLRRSFDSLRRLEPDIVVVTGDWVSYCGQSGLDDLARLMEHFPRGRLASLGILGNHDYGPGWRQPGVADALTSIAANAGVRMLRNESHEIQGLTVIGLEDLWGPRFGPPPGLRPVMSSAQGGGPREGSFCNSSARVVLCHNPDAADQPIWSGFRGWILAGHTHGGQCRSPFLPPPILPVRNRRYTSGEIPLDGERSLYINRGLGHLMKVRFCARPEITLHRLRAVSA